MGGVLGSALLGKLAALFGPDKPKPTPEQKAAMYLYSTGDRKVRAVPSRRPRKGDEA